MRQMLLTFLTIKHSFLKQLTINNGLNIYKKSVNNITKDLLILNITTFGQYYFRKTSLEEIYIFSAINNTFYIVIVFKRCTIGI